MCIRSDFTPSLLFVNVPCACRKECQSVKPSPACSEIEWSWRRHRVLRRAAYVAALQKRDRHLRCFCSECGEPCSWSETVNAPDHLVLFRRSGGHEIGDGRVAVGTNGTMLRRLHRDRGTRRRISRMLSLVLAEMPARGFIPREIMWNWKGLYRSGVGTS